MSPPPTTPAILTMQTAALPSPQLVPEAGAAPPSSQRRQVLPNLRSHPSPIQAPLCCFSALPFSWRSPSSPYERQKSQLQRGSANMSFMISSY